MFPSEYKIEAINEMGKGSMIEHLGIEFTEISTQYITAKMPVDHRTMQPFGFLHGGASVAMAESLGSFASVIMLDISKEYPAGLEINANHLKSVKSGFVYGRVEPIHIGKGTHVWDIKIKNEADQLVCISRLTVAILKNR
ncbi:MAG: hotdog fold thioesterase [Cyclobacteriaceae bacterium]